jgi:hypothetical protein
MDPAYAFAAICVHAGPKTSAQTVEDWVDGGLKKAGLRKAAEIRKAAIDAMVAEERLPSSLWILEGMYLRTAGLAIAKVRSKTWDPALTMSLAVAEKLPLPPLVDREGETGLLPYSSFDYTRWDPWKMFEVDYELQDALDNILSACR